MPDSDFGVIGLGAMGGGMARVLAENGNSVTGYDPDPDACRNAAGAGIKIEAGLRPLLSGAKQLVVCLPNEAALTGLYQQFKSTPAEKSQLVIETSTVAPATAQKLAQLSEASGRRHLESSLIGLTTDAHAGTLYHLVGGKREDLELAQDFLAITGRSYTHLGDVGSAAICKVLNNAIGSATMLVFSEAIVASEALGLSPEAFISAVKEAAGAGSSTVFSRHAHWATGTAGRQPPTPINLKDMKALGSILGNLGPNYELMNSAIGILNEMNDEDGLVQTYADQIRQKLHGHAR